MGAIRKLWTSLYRFNQYERDRWMEREASRIEPGSIVLDIGAGSCPYHMLFTNCIYRTQDFGQLEQSQILGKQGYGKIDYVCDATQIPIESASVDVVLCTEVLEHVPEPIKVIHEIGRIVRPGGIVLLTAPLGSGLHQLPYHFYGGYTPLFYRRFLQENGFEDVQVESNGNFFKFYSQEALRSVIRLSPFTLKPGLLISILWFPFWVLYSLCVIAVTPVFHWFDRFDHGKDFTIGYHVRARRCTQAKLERCADSARSQ